LIQPYVITFINVLTVLSSTNILLYIFYTDNHGYDPLVEVTISPFFPRSLPIIESDFNMNNMTLI